MGSALAGICEDAGLVMAHFIAMLISYLCRTNSAYRKLWERSFEGLIARPVKVDIAAGDGAAGGVGEE